MERGLEEINKEKWERRRKSAAKSGIGRVTSLQCPLHNSIHLAGDGMQIWLHFFTAEPNLEPET